MNDTPDYDSPWKEILDDYFEDFMIFFFPDAHAAIDWARGVEFFDKELQKIVADAALGRRYADKLVKVWLQNGAEVWVMIHVEVQGNWEEGFALRIYIYNHRIFERYNAPVASFVILTDDDPDWRPAEYRQELFGTATSFRFETAKLLDYEARWAELAANPNVFAVVAMAHLRVISTRRDYGARLNWKLELTKLLYERGYDKLTVLKLFRFLDWLMWLPEEWQQKYGDTIALIEEEKRVQYVTSVERRGIQKGLQQGLQQGSSRQLLRVVRGRFGQMPEGLEEKLAALTIEQLDALMDQALAAQSLAEFTASLPPSDAAATASSEQNLETHSDDSQSS